MSTVPGAATQPAIDGGRSEKDRVKVVGVFVPPHQADYPDDQVQIHVDKPLSFREKKMLDRSRHLLVSELAIAKGVRETEAEALMEKALNKADLSMPAVL